MSFDRGNAKQFGTRFQVRVQFSRSELDRTDQRYVQHRVRDAAMGALDDIVAKFKRENAHSNDGYFLGTEYRLDVTVMTQDDIDALFQQAYNAGARDCMHWGGIVIPPGEEDVKPR